MCIRDSARIAHIVALTLLGLLVLLLLFRDGQYSPGRRISRVDDAGSVLKNLTLAYLGTIGVVYATKGFFTGYSSLSRLVVLTDLGMLALLMVAARWGLWVWQ